MGKPDSGGYQGPILIPSQKRVLDRIANLVNAEIGKSGDVYPGQIVPGIAELQQEGWGQIGEFTDSSALSSMLSGQPSTVIDPAAREAVYGAEKARALGEFRTDIAPMIEERYQARGAGRSGGLQHSLSQAGGDLGLGLGSLYAGLGYQDEQARRALAESAAARQAQGLGLWGGGIQNMLAAGGTQRDIAGQQLGEGLGKWMMGQPAFNPWLGYLPQVLGTQARPGSSGDINDWPNLFRS